jgi:hypothetical protein
MVMERNRCTPFSNQDLDLDLDLDLSSLLMMDMDFKFQEGVSVPELLGGAPSPTPTNMNNYTVSTSSVPPENREENPLPSPSAGITQLFSAEVTTQPCQAQNINTRKRMRSLSEKVYYN